MKRPFGQGRSISLFTLGTMRALSSSAQMTAVLNAALDAGINHLETAPAYGPAEQFLGEAIATLERSGRVRSNHWVITSKLLPGLSLTEGQQQIKAILRRLNRSDRHGRPRFELRTIWMGGRDGSALLDWAISTGRVGQIGFSSHGNQPPIETPLPADDFSCCLHLHMLDPSDCPLRSQPLRVEWCLAILQTRVAVCRRQATLSSMTANRSRLYSLLTDFCLLLGSQP